MNIKSILAGMLAMVCFLQVHGETVTPHKITVSGGFLDDGTTTRSGLYSGDEVGVEIDWDKLYDKKGNYVNAFARWTYTPATADLGDGFSPLEPEVKVSMPNADVKMTANYVNGFAGYLYCGCYVDGVDAQGNMPEGDFYWSIDNGKTLFPFGDFGYPVKAGKVTVKFYDKTGKCRAADATVTINKRGTYKKGVDTFYDEPEYRFVDAKFVAVDNSTKVKLDLNGGTGTGEAFFANGWEYGMIAIMPSRKGYVFAGWWTAKDGGEHITPDRIFDPADFAGQKTPTLYAHWLQMKKLTLKDDFAYAYWDLEELDIDPELIDEVVESFYMMYPGSEGYCELEGKGVLEVLPGAIVELDAPDYTEDKNGNELVFQKWTVTPSKANLGPSFQVSQNDQEFTMPNEDVAFQASYIDEYTCGRLYAKVGADSINLGYNEYLGDYVYIEPPYGAFEWSPDGGKTWYKAGSERSYWVGGGYDGDWAYYEGEGAILKEGAYTVTWRSTDPSWQAPTDKTKATVWNGSDSYTYAQFTYIPQVVVDVMTFADGECTESSAGGTVTMNPKDGLVPAQKSITLTAKAAKDYAFQGWAMGKYWQYGDWLRETSTTYKLNNSFAYADFCSTPYSMLYDYIDPVDQKVHVVAVFKAIAEYSANDIVFNGFEGNKSCSYADYDGSGNASVTVKAVVGCALDEDYTLECGPLASPLTYKLDGKLPDGLKFDAKTGVLSGAPKKAGNTTVKITATDPAKHAKSITVYFEVSPLPTWLVGEYRGIMADYEEMSGYWDYDPGTGEEYWVDGESLPGPQNGILEMSVKSDGKVSAKVITRLGTRSVSGSLTWEASDVDAVGVYKFWHTDAKDDSYCHVTFSGSLCCPEGTTITGYVDSYDKTVDDWIGGDMVGMRQDTELLVDSPFVNKYYTFAFHAETTEQGGYWDDESGDWVDETYTEGSGYGYLTLKTDTKGVAKVTGQLPDGEKVSMSALVLPFGDEARLYVFASPSAYKKADWFAAALTLTPDGSVFLEDHAIWTPWVDISEYPGGEDYCGDDDMSNSTVSGIGAEYSSAQSIEGYYWYVSCEWDYGVELEYRWKDTYYDDNGKRVTYTDWNTAEAKNFDGYLFNVAVKGDKKGAISLAEKSPAPWKDGYGWNYWEDKNGNWISDPSQLSISFTRATGIFTGKATAYFDYEMPDTGKAQHATATLPYAGVMIDDGEGGYTGLGSAVYTSKCQYDYDKPFTKKVTLPVTLELDE